MQDRERGKGLSCQGQTGIMSLCEASSSDFTKVLNPLAGNPHLKGSLPTGELGV